MKEPREVPTFARSDHQVELENAEILHLLRVYLTEEEFQILELTFLCRLTQVDIARRLRVSTSKVTRLKQRALNSARRTLTIFNVDWGRPSG